MHLELKLTIAIAGVQPPYIIVFSSRLVLGYDRTIGMNGKSVILLRRLPLDWDLMLRPDDTPELRSLLKRCGVRQPCGWLTAEVHLTARR